MTDVAVARTSVAKLALIVAAFCAVATAAYASWEIVGEGPGARSWLVFWWLATMTVGALAATRRLPAPLRAALLSFIGISLVGFVLSSLRPLVLPGVLALWAASLVVAEAPRSRTASFAGGAVGVAPWVILLAT